MVREGNRACTSRAPGRPCCGPTSAGLVDAISGQTKGNALTKPEPMVDLVELISTFMKRRYFILLSALGVGLLSFGLSFILTPRYTAKVTLLPQNEKPGSELLGQVAAFTGAGLSSDSNYENLYAKILVSNRILDEVIARKWSWKDTRDGSLFQFFGVDTTGSSHPETQLKNILRDQVIGFVREKKTGYMTLSVEMGQDPQLAADLANFLAERLDNYIRRFRRHKAQEKRMFLEDELAKAKASLEVQESRLAVFLEQNRSYESSPLLQNEYRNLSREVDAASTFWLELNRQFALAIVDENRDKEIVNILDEAIAPPTPSFPKRRILGALGFLAGGCLALLIVFIQWARKSWRT